MELNQPSRNFSTSTLLLDTVAEQLADVDLTLPDYCPDIEKILKCTLTPKIQTKNLSGGQLRIDGICIVNVLYVESINKTIRCCEQNVSFSQCFTVKEASDNYVIMTKTKQEYINCRALSPRRLVMHGAFSLYAKVITTRQQGIWSDERGDLECLKQTARCADLRALCEEQFNICEDINISDKTKIESILYSYAEAGLTDAKAVTGKLMVSGEVSLNIYYLCNVETGESGKTEYVIPFNQIIDCEGIDENTINSISCNVMSYDLRLKNDMVSDSPSILADVKVCITEEGYVISDEELTCDAYSVECEMNTEKENLTLINELVPISDSFIQKLNIRTDNGKISKVLDIFSNSVSASESITENGVELAGKINISMLALNEDGYPVFIDRAFDFAHTISSLQGCNRVKNISCRAASISYRMTSDDEVEVRCEIKIFATGAKEEQYGVINGIEIFEDKKLPAEKCALTLYYATKGESLWQIAKAHKTKLDMLLNENNTGQLTLENEQMLLIPRV